MTTQTTPAASGVLASPRLAGAWLFVGYAGLYLTFQFFNWVLPGEGTFGTRSANAGFTTIVELALPLLAVLIANGAGQVPPLPQTKLIATVALVEYATMLLFGVLAYIIGLGALRGGSANATFDGLAYVVLGLGKLGLAALAGLVVYRAWVSLGGTLPIRLVRVRPTPPA